MKLENLHEIIDHTSIWPKATAKDIEKLCREALRYKFGCVCVNPAYVKMAVKILNRSKTKVGSTCGFPFGANRTDIKVIEARKAIDDGAQELDMVINIGALKGKDYKFVSKDIKAVVKEGVLCKVILEMSLLTQQEKVAACKIVSDSGADFLKTETGLWGPAKLSDVRLMKRIAGKKAKIKASGGIRTVKQVKQFVDAGASRIGTSRGVDIIKQTLN